MGRSRCVVRSLAASPGEVCVQIDVVVGTDPLIEEVAASLLVLVGEEFAAADIPVRLARIGLVQPGRAECR